MFVPSITQGYYSELDSVYVGITTTGETNEVSIIGNAMAAASITTIEKKIILPELLDTTIVLPCDWGIARGQCVCFVKDFIDKNGGDSSQYSGNAITWKRYINTDTPQVGDVVVMNNGWFGHVGIVIKVDGTSITIIERNFLGLWIVSERTIDISDATIEGFVRWQ